MEVACFKYMKKELQQGTNWTILREKRGRENRSVHLWKGDVGGDGEQDEGIFVWPSNVDIQ